MQPKKTANDDVCSSFAIQLVAAAAEERPHQTRRDDTRLQCKCARQTNAFFRTAGPRSPGVPVLSLPRCHGLLARTLQRRRRKPTGDRPQRRHAVTAGRLPSEALRRQEGPRGSSIYIRRGVFAALRPQPAEAATVSRRLVCAVTRHQSRDESISLALRVRPSLRPTKSPSPPSSSVLAAGSRASAPDQTDRPTTRRTDGRLDRTSVAAAATSMVDGRSKASPGRSVVRCRPAFNVDGCGRINSLITSWRSASRDQSSLFLMRFDAAFYCGVGGGIRRGVAGMRYVRSGRCL